MILVVGTLACSPRMPTHYGLVLCKHSYNMGVNGGVGGGGGCCAAGNLFSHATAHQTSVGSEMQSEGPKCCAHLVGAHKKLDVL